MWNQGYFSCNLHARAYPFLMENPKILFLKKPKNTTLSNHSTNWEISKYVYLLDRGGFNNLKCLWQ